MARGEKFTVAQIESALRKAAGVYTLAAAQVEKATGRGCAPNTVANYVKRHKRLQLVVGEILDQNLDVAEAGLLTHLRDTNLTAIIFYLKTKGKHRGYTERVENTGPDGGAMEVAVVRVPHKAASAEAWASQHAPNPGT